MCTGIPDQDSSSTTQSPVSCQISEPRRIWGPRLLPAHQACSAGLVGLAIVAAIQAELEMTTSSERANQQMPRQPTATSTSSSADQQMPRHSKAANQQMPRHSINQQKPRHCKGKSKGPSIFSISTPSWLNASGPQFSSLCFLCKRPLPSNKDIYMYRGDQAFCSQQCRYHQMAVDESKEKLCSRTSTFATTKCDTHSCTTPPNYYKHKERIFAYA